MAHSAQEAGASAILSVTPYYSKPSQAGMIAHFRAVADATELPVMLYDIPGRSAIGLADSTYDALAEHPRIVACKDATGDVPRAAERMKRTGLVWYSGDDPLNLDFMRAGAAGIVSVVAHVAARRYVEMIASHDAGDASRAQEISDSLEGLVDAIMGGGLGAVAAKSAVAALGVIPNRVMRLPHVPLDETQFSTLVAALKGAGYPTV